MWTPFLPLEPRSLNIQCVLEWPRILSQWVKVEAEICVCNKVPGDVATTGVLGNHAELQVQAWRSSPPGISALSVYKMLLGNLSNTQKPGFTL
jgi:hypothetical protein